MKIYVLKLQQGKFYVGRTNKPIRERFEEHQDGVGSAWTRKYPPLRVLYEMSTSDRFRENTETLKCMDRYGIENVRGGRYSQMSLSAADIDSITQEIRHSTDRCLRCGRKGHFQNSCYAKTHADGSPIRDSDNNGHGTYENIGSNLHDEVGDDDDDDDDDEGEEDSDEDDSSDEDDDAYY